jgi:hypothetical protein
MPAPLKAFDMSLLSIRAEGLRVNLDRIKDFLAQAPNRRTDLDKLKKELTDIRTVLREVRETMSPLKLAAEYRDTPKVVNGLDEVEKLMSKLVAGLQRVDEHIVSMEEKCFLFQEKDIGRDIGKNLNSRIDGPIQELIDIETALQKPGADLRKKWAVFLDKANNINRDVFAEYIEFLGGLALRDTGFDAGISQVAEELMRTYSPDRKNPDQALAIPARRRTVAMTLPRIIRVTFPDWTIWALPSTAHEFWNVVAKNDLKDRLQSALRDLTNDTDTIESRFNDCLGDAFATYTMGPAYAFFAIYLLLNPRSPFSTSETGQPADDVRALSISEMLKCMDSKETEIDPPYESVRKDLNSAWTDAIAETGAQPIVDQKKQIDEVKQVAEDKDRVTVLVKALWKTLTTGPFPPFTAYVWNVIGEWVDKLLENQVKKIEVPHGAELRHVLNAVWLARVHPKRKRELDITAVANELRKRVAMPEKSNQ